MEVWKIANGSNGHYEVSTMGRVRNAHTKYLLKPSLKGNGYYQVEFAYGIYKHFLIHRLVALAFIDNPLELKYVNHKDEIKTNNNVNNLEWCTAKYNSNYGVMALAKNKCILQIDMNGSVVNEWKSMKDAAIALKMPYQAISRVCRGKRRTAKGYQWKYMTKTNIAKEHKEIEE